MPKKAPGVGVGVKIIRKRLRNAQSAPGGGVGQDRV